MNNTKIYLLLGGNEGDREHWLQVGREGIELHIGGIVAESAIYETAAWGKEDQAAFLNQVIEVQTTLTAEKVLEAITQIEVESASRVRGEKWAARTLDIDILFYGEKVIKQEGLTIPHPSMQDRRFVLTPLHELAPDMAHPVLKQTITELLKECKDVLDVSLYQTTDVS